MRTNTIDKTCLSYWFPKLESAGIPVPKTTIIEIPDDVYADVLQIFDGNPPSDIVKTWADMVAVAGEKYGTPFFLRTGQTSGKHYWKGNCFVSDPSRTFENIMGIVEYSEMAGIIGLDWKTWAVREMLPTIPFGVCRAFGDMPVCREFRFFVKDGAVECFHPYWPKNALEQGVATDGMDFDELCRVPDKAALIDLAEAAGRAVPGHWSIDILETSRGWFVTDMAEAHKSFHWEGCQS